MRRSLGIALGIVCTAIGTAGVFLPGIPGTLFLLAASWLFARSSPRLQRWLREHPRLGPYVRAAEERSMPRRARVISLAGIWIGVTLAIAAGPVESTAARVTLVALGLIGSAVLVFGLRGRTAAPEKC